MNILQVCGPVSQPYSITYGERRLDVPAGLWNDQSFYLPDFLDGFFRMGEWDVDRLTYNSYDGVDSVEVLVYVLPDGAEVNDGGNVNVNMITVANVGAFIVPTIQQMYVWRNPNVAEPQTDGLIMVAMSSTNVAVAAGRNRDLGAEYADLRFVILPVTHTEQDLVSAVESLLLSHPLVGNHKTVIMPAVGGAPEKAVIYHSSTSHEPLHVDVYHFIPGPLLGGLTRSVVHGGNFAASTRLAADVASELVAQSATGNQLQYLVHGSTTSLCSRDLEAGSTRSNTAVLAAVAGFIGGVALSK